MAAVRNDLTTNTKKLMNVMLLLIEAKEAIIFNKQTNEGEGKQIVNAEKHTSMAF